MKTKRSEKWVKDQVKKVLNDLDCFYFMPQAGPYGRSGVPDFIACKHVQNGYTNRTQYGQFVAIEAKAGYNKPTDLQEACMLGIRKAGGMTMVVNEDNLDMFREWLKGL